MMLRRRRRAPHLLISVTPPLVDAWIDDLGSEFVDDLGTVVVFAP